jgi:hypothetical protein
MSLAFFMQMEEAVGHLRPAKYCHSAKYVSKTMKNTALCCEISGSHGGEHKDDGFLGCCAV